MLGRSRAERAVRLSSGEETRGDQIEYAIRAWNRVLGPRPSRPSSDG